jgi:chemotaxis protein histidine kinase CheA
MPDPNEQQPTGAEATYAQQAAEHPGETYAEQAERQAAEAEAAPPIRITDPRIGHLAVLRAIYAEVCQTLLSETEQQTLNDLAEQAPDKFKDSVAAWTVQMLVNDAVAAGVIPDTERADWDYLNARASGESEKEFAARLDSLQDRIQKTRRSALDDLVDRISRMVP